MNKIALAVAMVLPLAGLLAQDQAKKKRGGKAKREYEALVKDLDAARAAYSKEIGKIVKTDEYKAAVKDRDREAMMALRGKVTPVDQAAFVAQFQAGAQKYAGKAGAARFLTWLALYSRDAEVTKASVDTLLDTHIKRKSLVTFAENLRYTQRYLGPERYAEVCKTLAEKSPHSIVRAYGMYWPASVAVNPRNRNVSDEQREAAQKVLGEVEQLAAGTLLADRIAAPRFVEERLQIGMVAPDIAGQDIDGVDFKLTDYRGKVVVIDFWGDW